MIKNLFPVAVVLTGLAAACSKDPDMRPAAGANEPPADRQAPGLIGNQAAITKITSARCDREQRCGNVGAGKTYDDRNACENKVGQNTQSDLRASECAGVVPKELDECIDEVTNQACNNPIDAVTRLAACTRSQLCP
jgi:hypothetical protein